jgi:ABC-2 type transport system permease protein
MNQSLHPVANPLPGAGLWWETRASLAFVERNLYLVRRYWHLELAFLIFNVASAMSVLYIGEAQMQYGGTSSQEGQLDLVLYLGIGTVVWAYLRAVFANVGEMVAWERWEGTIEYTMMAPISRLAHMLGVSLFSIIYGLARSALLLGVLSLFFNVDLSHANLGGAALILLVGSVSFLGFGIMAAVLPLLFPERGEEMTFVISSILLLVSGVYYPISVLPDWMEPLATISPATYVL